MPHKEDLLQFVKTIIVVGMNHSIKKRIIMIITDRFLKDNYIYCSLKIHNAHLKIVSQIDE